MAFALGLTFLLAFGTALLLTPLTIRAARRWGIGLDLPGDPRRVHRRPTPRLGGIALFLAYSLALAWSLGAVPRSSFEVSRILHLWAGAVLLFAVMLWDDLRGLSPVAKLLWQGLAALIPLLPPAGIVIDSISSPWGSLPLPTWFAYPFTLFWILGMVNTVNWLDGLDGLAGGVVLLASAVLAFHTFRLGQFSLVFLPVALAGAVVGFLPYNRHPARTFMGDAGSNVLGYLTALHAVIGGAKLATTLLVLALPILDVAWIIFRRLRQGRSPAQADRSHLHHRLLDRGLNPPRVVWLYWGITALTGALGLLLPSPWYKLYALVGLGVLTLGAFLWLDR